MASVKYSQLHENAVMLQSGQVYIKTFGTAWFPAMNEPANLVDVAIAPGPRVYALDSGGTIYRYNWINWEKDANAKNVVGISADEDGNLWCVANTGQVFLNANGAPLGQWSKVYDNVPKESGEATGQVWEYTVQLDEWLYKIVRAQYGTGSNDRKTAAIVEQIKRMNPAIGDGENIIVGTKLKMPPKN
jgi:hypothetical protein